MGSDHYSSDDELVGTGGRPKKVSPEAVKQLEALLNMDLGPVDKRLLSAGGEVLDLLIKKNKDYGDDNLRKFGRFGILVRVADKVERIKNLLETKTAAVVSESERDTWMDIAGYAIQALRLIDENRK